MHTEALSYRGYQSQPQLCILQLISDLPTPRNFASLHLLEGLMGDQIQMEWYNLLVLEHFEIDDIRLRSQ